ncbi:MAG: acetate/propionate family kinase [Rhodobacteraceae bacterium]|nr:acetate/propionate family kinase [Paracoccaceae bacterium]
MSIILTLNAGSSSIKFGVYEAAPEPVLLQVGQVENLGPTARLCLKGRDAVEIGPADHASALPAILQAVKPVIDGKPLVGVGHRIVHGGKNFAEPLILSEEVLTQLAALEPLAPLHQPHNLRTVRAAQEAFPGVPQIGCFDTAFHVGHPFVNDTFAIPRRFYEKGVRRYGFHGLSYDYITSHLRKAYPELAKGKVVVVHLGNGASMCAIENGQSIGSTMGFSALDGLPMGTRSGQLDPGVLLYLMEQGFSREAITHILYKESGLKGLSGISHDMRTLLASDDPRAQEAIDYYVFRIRRELGAMAAILGGLDALVFCGGIGENAAPIRAQVLKDMEFLGLHLDEEANVQNGPLISTGPVEALVIPTDEERIIARAVARLT